MPGKQFAQHRFGPCCALFGGEAGLLCTLGAFFGSKTRLFFALSANLGDKARLHCFL